jgi:hypothetical protein
MSNFHLKYHCAQFQLSSSMLKITELLQNMVQHGATHQHVIRIVAVTPRCQVHNGRGKGAPARVRGNVQKPINGMRQH